jgi:Tfp pilus assembly protein PilZ
MAFDSHLGKFGTTARLFQLVSKLPEEKQLILLKALLRNNVGDYLFKLIVEMSFEQQRQLLERLGEIPNEEMPLKTIRLDEYESSMRETPRKSCMIKVECHVGKKTFKSYIIDISPVGVLIESEDNFPVGQKVMLAFSLPGHSDFLQLSGEIAWSGFQGFGIKFRNLSAQQRNLIKSFVDGR